jgi:hypothetical protein
VIIIFVSWILFLFAVFAEGQWNLGEWKDHSNRYLYIGLGVTLLWGFLLALSTFLKTSSFDFVGWHATWPISWRNKLLVFTTVAIIVIMGVMVVLSGGSVNSGFSHFLIATSSIALLMARTNRIRFWIVAITLLMYLVGLLDFVEPVVTLSKSNGLFWKVFNGVSVLSTVILATVAASIGMPVKNGQRANGSSSQSASGEASRGIV